MDELADDIDIQIPLLEDKHRLLTSVEKTIFNLEEIHATYKNGRTVIITLFILFEESIFSKLNTAHYHERN